MGCGRRGDLAHFQGDELRQAPAQGVPREVEPERKAGSGGHLVEAVAGWRAVGVDVPFALPVFSTIALFQFSKKKKLALSFRRCSRKKDYQERMGKVPLELWLIHGTRKREPPM